MPTINEVKPIYEKFQGALFNFVKAPGAEEAASQVVQKALEELGNFDLANYGTVTATAQEQKEGGQ